MKVKYIITTYDTKIVGSKPWREGMLDTMYYMSQSAFCYTKKNAHLFDSYEEAQAEIENRKINHSQIEKVFIKDDSNA